MSRLRPLSVFAVLAALSVVLVACGAGGDKGDESPQTVLDEATLEGIESGDIDLSLGLAAQGPEGGAIELSLSGPFQGEGAGSLPQLDLTAKADGTVDGEKVDFEGGIVLLPNSAYVNYEGVEYEVDPTTFSFIEATLNQAQREAGVEAGSAGAAACQEELGKLKVADFVEDARNEGSADVDGTGTTKVSGELEVSAAIDALLEVAESQACRAQLSAAGSLPSESEIEEAKDEVNSSLKSARATVYVGDDDIVRRLELQLAVEPRDEDGKGPKSVEIDLDLTLSGVNEEQKISAPENAKPLSRLFLKLGINPIELLGLLQGEDGGKGLGELLERLGLPDSPSGF